jgi:hypothetical protein
MEERNRKKNIEEILNRLEESIINDIVNLPLDEKIEWQDKLQYKYWNYVMGKTVGESLLSIIKNEIIEGK